MSVRLFDENEDYKTDSRSKAWEERIERELKQLFSDAFDQGIDLRDLELYVHRSASFVVTMVRIDKGVLR